MRSWIVWPLAVLLLLALAGCGSSSSSNNGTGSSDVTLSGTLQPAAAAASAHATGSSAPMATLDPTQYVLYCVTFTNPTHAGNGNFDATGAFTVTISSAAGLPVGCFINDKSTNEPVTTLTFQVGSGGGLDSGSGTSATLDGGDYSITINFDPTSGTATADISQITTSTAPASANFDPAALVGSWSIACADATDANCAQFIGNGTGATSMPVYIDVLKATSSSGDTLYAMGPWPDQATYTAAGSTEAIDPTQIPAGYTAVSLNTSDPNASATNAFNGFTGSANYDRTANAISGDNLAAYMTSIGHTYDPTFDDSMGDWCTQTGPLDLSLQQDRSCLLEFVQSFIEQQASQAYFFPWPSGTNWGTFANDPTATGASLVTFHSGLGSSPSITERYDLMDLELQGDSAIASSEWHDSYTDQNNQTCTDDEKLSIVMTMNDSTNTSATGYFTQQEYNSCNTSNQPAAIFQVNFTKQ